MMAYSGGDEFPCVVGEVGSYYTKMGFAGEAYPRSYFRSTTAILRSRSGGSNKDKDSNKISKRSYDFFSRSLSSGFGGAGGEDNSMVLDSERDQGGMSTADGEWEVCNPIESSTGLIYDGRLHEKSNNASNNSPSSSLNANHGQGDAVTATEDDDVVMEDNDANATPSTSLTSSTKSSSIYDDMVPGECYAHFLNHLTHGYESALCTDPSTTPLLLVERSYNPPPIRQKMMEILFEELNVPATFLARDAVCACYAVGRSTGTVVDVGYNGTVVTPVYEGYVENKGILRSPVGSELIEQQMLDYLDSLYKTKKSRSKLQSKYDYIMPLYQVRSKDNQPRREPFHSLARLDMVRLCKEDGTGAGVASYGYASLHDLVAFPSAEGGGEEEKPEPSDIYQQYAVAPKTPFKLPDGTQIDIPQTKRFDVTELLFGKDGGKSAKIREEAVRKAKEQLSDITATIDDTATEANALAHLEEMTRRKRGSVNKNAANKKQSVYLSHEKLVKACAPYLQSAIGELTASSIPSMICDSAFRCDRDQQAQLLANTILCGGGACLSTAAISSPSVDYLDGNAMPERIRLEVEALIHTHTPQWRVKVSSPGLTERAVCSWIGASILGSLGSFHEMWITKAEYEEHGTAIVNRKCP